MFVMDGESRRHCCYDPTSLGLQANDPVQPATCRSSRFEGSVGAPTFSATCTNGWTMKRYRAKFQHPLKLA